MMNFSEKDPLLNFYANFVVHLTSFGLDLDVGGRDLTWSFLTNGVVYIDVSSKAEIYSTM